MPKLKIYTVNCVIQPAATATGKDLYSELCVQPEATAKAKDLYSELCDSASGYCHK